MAVIYLWQIALLRPHVIHRAASWAGLYVISRGTPPGQLALQLLHLTALVVLFGALGCYGGGGSGGGGGASDDPSARVRQRLARITTSATAMRARPQVHNCDRGLSRDEREQTEHKFAVCMATAASPQRTRSKTPTSHQSVASIKVG